MDGRRVVESSVLQAMDAVGMTPDSVLDPKVVNGILQIANAADRDNQVMIAVSIFGRGALNMLAVARELGNTVDPKSLLSSGR